VESMVDPFVHARNRQPSTADVRGYGVRLLLK